MVNLYTDGACSLKLGRGGWAYILEHPKKKIEVYGYALNTTNNKMELIAVLKGLQRLNKPTEVYLYSDSNYVVSGIDSWMYGWEKSGWRIKNSDLWKEAYRLCGIHKVKANWVKGHSGHPQNERCDELAVKAYMECTEGENVC